MSLKKKEEFITLETQLVYIEKANIKVFSNYFAIDNSVLTVIQHSHC